MNSTGLSDSNRTPPSHAEIEQRAYQIWCEEGFPLGRAEHHWHQAEQELSTGVARRARTEDVPLQEDVPPMGSSATHAAFARSAPLATKVEEQLIEPGRPMARRSKTSVEL